MKQRAVLFDLGNTLVSYYQVSEFGPILDRCLKRCCRMLGRETAGSDYTALVERALEMNQERSDYAVRPLAGRLRELFDLSSADAAQLEALCGTFLEPIWALGTRDESALAVLRALRSRGIRTGLVSNTPWGSAADSWRQELDRHDLLPLLDVCVFCTDVGYRKPHAAPFERALQLLSVRPECTLFVGDDPEWDVRGARAACLTPVLLVRSESVQEGGCAVISNLGDLVALVDGGSESSLLAGVG